MFRASVFWMAFQEPSSHTVHRILAVAGHEYRSGRHILTHTYVLGTNPVPELDTGVPRQKNDMTSLTLWDEKINTNINKNHERLVLRNCLR